MVVLMAFGGLLIAASVVLIAYLVATARREDSYDDFATEDTVAVFEDDGRLFVFASPADGEWYVEFIGEATEAA